MRSTKTGIICLLASCGFSAVTNVTVHTTHRQAVIAYVAPTASACTLSVYTDSARTAEVNDTSTALFGAGANLDSRAGSIPAGRSRVFVAGQIPLPGWSGYSTTETTSSPLTVSTATRATGVSTVVTSAVHGLYVFDHVTIAGVTDSSFDAVDAMVLTTPTTASFTYANAGTNGSSSGGTATRVNRFSRTLQADTQHWYRITCGSDTYDGTFRTANIPLGNTQPETLAADSVTPGAYNWPTMGSPSSRAESIVDPATGALIRKITMASEGDVSWNNNTWPAGGMSQLCSHLLSSAGGHTYNLCFVPAAVYSTLYSIETDTGNAYALTRVFSPYGSFGCLATAGVQNVAFSSTDPLRIYFANNCSDGNGIRVYTGRWTGALNASNHVLASVPIPPDSDLVVSVLTPSGLVGLLRTFDPLFDATQEANLIYIDLDGAQDGKLLFHIVSQQDSMGWVVVFDPGNDLPIGSGGTGGVVAANPFWSSPASRWCTLHTLTPAGDNNPWISVQSNSPFASGVEMGSPYSVTVASNDGTGSTLHLAPTNGSYEPQSTTGAPAYLQDALPGDLFWVNAIGPGSGVEPIELVIKDVVNHTWTVLRGNQLSGSMFIQGSSMTAVVVTPTNITAGAKLYAACRATSLSAEAYGGGMWYWNYLNDPHGTSAVYPAAEGAASDQVVENHSSGGHQVTRDSINVMARYINSSLGWLYWTYPSGTPGYSAVTGSNFINGSPKFAGVGQADTNAYQMHPSYDQTAAADNEKQWFVDAVPMINGGGIYPASGALVSGQSKTYKMANATLHRKQLPTFASCGIHSLVDVSSPTTGNVISDATPYTYCVAAAADECRTGAVLGDVFVNCPGATVLTCNTAPVDAHTTDICIGDAWAYGNGAVQASFATAARNGASGRLISQLFDTHHGESQYQNVRPTSDGKWLMFSSTNPTGTNEAYMAKLPPWPPSDSTNRADFVPVMVSLGGMSGAVKTIIEFGYAPDGLYRCTQRAETCVAAAATYVPATPYYFATVDTYTGVDCSSGCTIVVPAISGRVVYWRVKYRDAGGNAMAVTPPQIVVAP